MARVRESGEVETPRRRVRFGRILVLLGILALAAGGLYVAAWVNAGRYYLVVEEDRVGVYRGRMLPVGREPFVPSDPALRQAYEGFPLPETAHLPRGESIYTERTELDQALFRLLRDAAEQTLGEGEGRAPELGVRYLEQMKALPGVNVAQQTEVARLERDARYVQAEVWAARAEADLLQAAAAFRASARGEGRFRDGEARAARLEEALARLKGAEEAVGAPAALPKPAEAEAPEAGTATAADARRGEVR